MGWPIYLRVEGKMKDRVAGWSQVNKLLAWLLTRRCLSSLWSGLLGLRVAASIDSLMELCWAGARDIFNMKQQMAPRE